MQLGNQDGQVTLFQDYPIRRAWHENEWYYSIVDAMAILAQTPRPSAYWNDLKRKLAREGSDIYADSVKIKLPGQDGRMVATECANNEMLLRLVQTVESPNAEPFKMWLAGLGASQLASGQQTELDNRIEYRDRLLAADDKLFSLVRFRGIVLAQQRQEFIDANYEGLYSDEHQTDIRVRKGVQTGESEYDYMSAEEAADNLFARVQTHALIARSNVRGAMNLNNAAYNVGVETRLAIQRMGGTMPENLPTPNQLETTTHHQLEGE